MFPHSSAQTLQNLSALQVQGRNAKRSVDSSAQHLQDKNAGMFQLSSARSFLEMLRGKNVKTFQNRNAVALLMNNARMFQSSSALMFPIRNVLLFLARNARLFQRTSANKCQGNSVKQLSLPMGANNQRKLSYFHSKR